MKFIWHRVVRSDISDEKKVASYSTNVFKFLFQRRKEKMYFRIFFSKRDQVNHESDFFPPFSILISIEI